YYIDQDKAHMAAYYRNTVIHFFLLPAIAELAALEAAEMDGDGTELFWEQVLEIRDLLKFEFFFPTKKRFKQQISDELDRRAPDWEAAISEGGDHAATLATTLRPLVAHWVLRPFLEAYAVVADVLADLDPSDNTDDEAVIKRAMGLGKQYQLQSRIRSPESISKSLFENALKLAKNRTGDLSGPDLVAARQALAAEIQDVLERIDAVAVAAVD
ncbi:MAG: glycerol-3-phosphate acyltransferase, partial [Acidimicrobiia bacterium]|nr:glycerol-3-phosphate acyltransferase [Acidimicrobiia bacterium]